MKLFVLMVLLQSSIFAAESKEKSCDMDFEITESHLSNDTLYFQLAFETTDNFSYYLAPKIKLDHHVLEVMEVDEDLSGGGSGGISASFDTFVFDEDFIKSSYSKLTNEALFETLNFVILSKEYNGLFKVRLRPSKRQFFRLNDNRIERCVFEGEFKEVFIQVL